MSRWVGWIVNQLLPAFGGIPTFCEDPDGLLEMPEVREALRQSGMTLYDWDGSSETLALWKIVDDDAKPLLVVGSDAKRHVAEATLPDLIWMCIGVGDMLPRFYVEVVKSVSPDHWDRLLTLHDQERYKRPPQESATLIGRALYGIDPEYLKHSDAGWLALLARIASEPEGIPLPIARAVIEVSPPPKFLHTTDLVGLLTEPTTAKSSLIACLAGDEERKCFLGNSERIVLAHLVAEPSAKYETAPQTDLLALWEEHTATMDGVLRFGLLYGEAVANDSAGETVKREVNRRFLAWLETQYGLMLSSHNPAVLRLHRLLERLDEEVGSDRLLLLVVDAMGLISWQHIRARWEQDGIIARAETRSAFAIIPTVTTLSRRALFEGKLPASFSDDKHSQRLERTLWLNRFGTEGAYFGTDEESGQGDAFALGRRRVCVIDTSWDKRGHSIDPKTETLAEAARTWAGRTPLRSIVQKALGSGYRVMLAADHGHVECVGRGRPNVGTLPEERSKRVMIFSNDTLCRQFEDEHSLVFRPAGLSTDIFPLFARDQFSFDIDNAQTVSHGGISLEEVLVPVAEVFA